MRSYLARRRQQRARLRLADAHNARIPVHRILTNLKYNPDIEAPEPYRYLLADDLEWLSDNLYGPVCRTP